MKIEILENQIANLKARLSDKINQKRIAMITEREAFKGKTHFNAGSNNDYRTRYYNLVLALKTSGLKTIQIAALIGCDKSTAASHINRAIRLKEYKPKNDVKKLTPDSSVNDLELSARAANIINNANILTIGQIQSTPMDQFKKFRQCGLYTISEIQYQLKRHNLKGIGSNEQKGCL